MSNGVVKPESELCATQGMFDRLREELKADMTDLNLRMDSTFLEIKKLRTGMLGLHKKLKIDTSKLRKELMYDVAGLRNELSSDKEQLLLDLKSEIARMQSSTHRSQSLVEEQNRNNRYMLDGLMGVFERQKSQSFLIGLNKY